MTVWIYFLFVFSPFSPFILSSRFPFLSLPPPPPFENVNAAILFYAVLHLHEGTEKLRKICADTVDDLTESVPSLQSLKKWPPTQHFHMQAADRRSPIQVLTQRLTDPAAWLGWSPSTTHRTLSVSMDIIFIVMGATIIFNSRKYPETLFLLTTVIFLVSQWIIRVLFSV